MAHRPGFFRRKYKQLSRKASVQGTAEFERAQLTASARGVRRAVDQLGAELAGRVQKFGQMFERWTGKWPAARIAPYDFMGANAPLKRVGAYAIVLLEMLASAWVMTTFITIDSEISITLGVVLAILGTLAAKTGLYFSVVLPYQDAPRTAQATLTGLTRGLGILAAVLTLVLLLARGMPAALSGMFDIVGGPVAAVLSLIYPTLGAAIMVQSDLVDGPGKLAKSYGAYADVHRDFEELDSYVTARLASLGVSLPARSLDNELDRDPPIPGANGGPAMPSLASVATQSGNGLVARDDSERSVNGAKSRDGNATVGTALVLGVAMAMVPSLASGGMQVLERPPAMERTLMVYADVTASTLTETRTGAFTELAKVLPFVPNLEAWSVVRFADDPLSALPARPTRVPVYAEPPCPMPEKSVIRQKWLKDSTAWALKCAASRDSAEQAHREAMHRAVQEVEDALLSPPESTATCTSAYGILLRAAMDAERGHPLGIIVTDFVETCGGPVPQSIAKPPGRVVLVLLPSRRATGGDSDMLKRIQAVKKVAEWVEVLLPGQVTDLAGKANQ
jgi:hypothetical protein